MYLVEDRRTAWPELVFVMEDPRREGYDGPVTEGVSLDYDVEVHVWDDGEPVPECVVGQDPADPGRYKVFKFGWQLKEAGFRRVPGGVTQVNRWSHYLARRQVPTPS